ncbi:unnamed protein product, partial [Musa textilis]
NRSPSRAVHLLLVTSSLSLSPSLTWVGVSGGKMLHGFFDAITGKHHEAAKSSATVKGSVLLTKKNVLDFNDFNASLLDGLHEFLGKGVSLQLVSATVADPVSSSSSPISLHH